MRIPKKAQIEKAGSTDKTRVALQDPYLDVEAKKIIATDGRIMAMVPVDVDDDDVSGIVPQEALKAARKVKETAEACVACNGDAKVLWTGASYPRPDLKFPNYKHVIPDRTGDVVVVLDPQLLLKLAQAMGVAKGEGIEIHLDPTNWDCRGSQGSGMEVRSKNGSTGVIMPMRRDYGE